MFDFSRYETKECLWKNALISGAGSVIGSSINAIAQSAINNQNIEYDKEVREQEHSRNLEKMAEQTRLNKEQFDHEFATESAWNNESAQRARMEAAGLNPALMYGTGASGSQVNASIGSTSISSGPGGPGAIAKSPDLIGLGSVVTDSMLAMSQKRVQDANANKINSEIADPTPVAEGERPTPGQLAYMQMQENLMSERYGNKLKAIELEIANDTKGARTETIKQNLVNLRQQLVNDKELTQSMVANYNALAQKYGEETIDLKETRASRIALNQSAVEKNEWESAHLRAKNYWMNELKPDEKSKIKAEINELISRSGVNEQKAKYAKLYAINECIRTGVFTLSELRKWTQLFLDKNDKEQDSAIKQMTSDPDFIWDAAQIAGAIL